MKRAELAHILRAACDVAKDSKILVIGSQSILGTFNEDELPVEALLSIEADVAFFDDPDERKSDAVDGAIGEESPFHGTFGVYGQGVGISTAVLPVGWQKRLVSFDEPNAPNDAVCLDAHDLVVSKLVAGRQKDLQFARLLLKAGLVQAETLLARVNLLPVLIGQRRRLIEWVQRNV